MSDTIVFKRFKNEHTDTGDNCEFYIYSGEGEEYCVFDTKVINICNERVVRSFVFAHDWEEYQENKDEDQVCGETIACPNYSEA